MSEPRPKTLMGQMAEFKRAWLLLFAAVAKGAWGLRSYESALEASAQRQRDRWHDLERDFHPDLKDDEPA